MIATLLAASIDDYRIENLEGWEVRVHSDAWQDPLWADGRRLLVDHLFRIKRAVPQERVKQLQQVIVWVHRESDDTQCMAYHPGAGWLREHGENPEMEHDIEIGSIARFLSWTKQQPWMVMHELAHAYHHRFLDDGFQNEAVLGAFREAMEAGHYESVLRYNGEMQRHYACNNQMEYFAEATEAYFGQNDFYPFVRSELSRFDPKGYALMGAIWGD